ncbi:MAG: four helix bundle protein [Saprospiraceae bacterium]|nr:four helix bundle protein [Lewinellaceae bacterium]
MFHWTIWRFINFPWRLERIVWDLIVGWNSLAQKTVGEQFVRAADSIAANIAEGYGRYFFKEQNNSVITAVAPCWNQKPGQLRQEIAS